jgi:hypothetical protein
VHGGNGSGKLSREQVANALVKTLSDFERASIVAVVQQVWKVFASNDTSMIGSDLLMKPQRGVIDTVHMQMMWHR